MLERRLPRIVAAATAVAVVVALAGGFILEPDGFAGNVLAEIAGVLLSVLLAVFIVDKLLERERRRRWDLVSSETIATLRFAVIRAGHSVYLLLPAPRLPEADPYTMSMTSPSELPDALDKLATGVRELDLKDLGTPDEVVGCLAPHLGLMRDGIMPRLLAIGEHELIALLASVESAFQDLEHSAWLTNRFGDFQQLVIDVEEVVRALSRVAEVVDQGQHPSPGS